MSDSDIGKIGSSDKTDVLVGKSAVTPEQDPHHPTPAQPPAHGPGLPPGARPAVLSEDPADEGKMLDAHTGAPVPPPGGSVAALEGAANDVLIGVKETGDAALRFEVHGDGSIHWGDETTADLLSFYVEAADTLAMHAGLLNLYVPDATGESGGYFVTSKETPWDAYVGLHPSGRFELQGINPTDAAFDIGTGVTQFFTMLCDGTPHWRDASSWQATVGAAGGASALPATPTKFVKVLDETGATLVIPAYAA